MKITGADEPAEADLAAYQQIAAATDVGFHSVLETLARQNPDQAEAILAGAVEALVRFTFAHCWPEQRLRTERSLVGLWGPLVKHAAKREGAV